MIYDIKTSKPQPGDICLIKIKETNLRKHVFMVAEYTYNGFYFDTVQFIKLNCLDKFIDIPTHIPTKEIEYYEVINHKNWFL
jgi:hypothetical protein